MQILGASLLACLICTTTGCGPSRGVESDAEAFRLRLVRGVNWTSDTLRFDPRLPGYHLRGGIGTIELHREPETNSGRLVLEISTSPGMQPNLESFTLGWGDTLLKVAPFVAGTPAEVIAKNPEGRWKTVSQRDTQDYFEFQRRDSTVMVSFLPAALQLIRKECTITWIDWYRR